MSKNEMQYLDSSLIGPAMLFLNQYFDFVINEYYVLWLCFVSNLLLLLLYWIIHQSENIILIDIFHTSRARPIF